MKATLPRMLGLAALLVSLQAQANIIVSLQPADQSINTGDPVSLDLVISGLGDHTAPSLGGFIFDLNYDPAVLSPVSITFGSHLDLGVVGSLRNTDLSAPGTIQLYEVSLETIDDLNAAQPSSFTLATLDFTGIGPGTSAVDFASGGLSDETGLISLQFTTAGAEIKVSGNAVLPDSGSTAGLLALGFAGVAILRCGMRGAELKPQ